MKKLHTLFLIALTAPVGSGKSYIARILAKKLGALHIRTDDIRVGLRNQGKSYAQAPRIAAAQRDQALADGRSVICDFDAVLPKRQRELAAIARKYNANFFLIHIQTPLSLIIQRLRKHHYTKNDLFTNADEAIRVYYIRRKFHTNALRIPADFVINNAKPLAPQIRDLVKKMRAKRLSRV